MENGSLDFETSMKKLQGILNLVFFQPPSLPKTSPPWEQMSLCIIEAIDYIMRVCERNEPTQNIKKTRGKAWKSRAGGEFIASGKP